MDDFDFTSSVTAFQSYQKHEWVIIKDFVQWNPVGSLVVLAFETVFLSISSRLPERGRKESDMIDERKKCQNNHPPAPTASTVGPCLTIIQ